jgi:hypothetical protein
VEATIKAIVDTTDGVRLQFIWGRDRSDLFVADCRRRSLTRMRSAFCVGQNLPQALDARVSYNIVQDALDYLTNIET